VDIGFTVTSNPSSPRQPVWNCLLLAKAMTTSKRMKGKVWRMVGILESTLYGNAYLMGRARCRRCRYTRLLLWPQWNTDFDVSLTVHLSKILEINQLDAQNLMYYLL
jgi:hypothetical protein